MHALESKRLSPVLTLIFSALILVGCGKGDGPQSIAGTAATPLPPIPPGFCDAINFEILCPPATIINFNGGATIVIDNPDASGINDSDKVAQMQKFPDQSFGGTKLDQPSPVDFSLGEAYTMKVWSSRAVPITFKLDEQNKESVVSHTGSGSWEELCFDFTGNTAGVPVIGLTVIFDNGVLGMADIDAPNWTFYYDDILQVASCGGGGGGGTGTPIIPDDVVYATDPGEMVDLPPPSIDNFGSGAVFDFTFAGDADYNPALQVTSGEGYGAGVHVGFIALTGYAPGFAAGYETLNFKVKGLPSDTIEVKFIEGGDTSIVYNVTTYSGSGDIGNGWYQVSIPMTDFAATIDANQGFLLGPLGDQGATFSFLLTDIGFSGTAGGGGGGTGVVPDDVVYATDPGEMVDLPPPSIDNFGSGAVFDFTFAGDADYNPALQVTSGEGYGAGVHVGFIALTGYAPGFAAGYETFNFKVKGLPAGTIEVKFIEGGDTSIVYDVTTYSGASNLGNGWYQVTIPISDFAATIDANQGFLLGPLGDQGAAFSFLLTDIGFSGMSGGGGGGTGVIPDDVVYATDPGEMVDLPPPAVDNFGSGAAFDFTFAGDADYNPALQVTSGEGYGAGVHVGFIALTGYAAGFAAGYETFNFKVKGLPAGTIEVKFIEGGDTSIVYDVTTYSGASNLGNGWYQVTIPISDFAATIDANQGFLLGPLGDQGAAFSFLLTDIGFSGMAGGGGGAGITPEAVVYATDPGVTEDLAPPAIDNFGSGAAFDGAFASDADFNPAFQVVSGEGYGAGVHVGFVAFNGYTAGFASGYGTFEFKAKINDIAASVPFEVKFINGGDTSQTYDLTTYAGSTDLGNGWYQVQIPMTDFAATSAANSGFLLGPLGGQANAFTMLLTDIGFSGMAGGGGGGGAGITPEAVVYATDPGVTEDLAPPAIDNFGSGAAFDGAFAADADFNPAFQVVSGEGYGAGVHVGFVAFNGYAAGFAAGYGTFEFKAKINDIAASAPFEVKFINGGDTSQTYDLTTYAGSTALGNGWYQVQIPMTDFAATIAANSGFLLGPLGGQANAFTMLLTDIGFSGTAGGGGSCDVVGGEYAVNGDFEAGDTSCIETFPNGGTIAADNTENNGGSWSVHVVAGPGNNPVVKLERRAVGIAMGNDIVDVSFDMKGTAADGGVIFPEFISEGAGGAASSQLLETIASPTAGWTTYSYSPTAAADVSEGITFQIAVVCGGVATCSADVYIDNISMQIR